MFSLTNDTPKQPPRAYDTPRTAQRKLFSGMHCPPGTRDLFAGLDDQSGEPGDGPPDAGPDMPPESIDGEYWIRYQNTAQGPYATKLEAVAAYRGLRRFHTQENNQ
jgi:hypothetical protein